MSDAYYDVVVVGTELPGLITAAMLAKKNYRVLVVGHGHSNNEFIHEGFRCIRRPWLFSGFETSTPIKKVFAELALSLEMHNRPKPFDPFYQIVMPKARIDVAAKESVFQRELQREFPDDVDKIQHFYRVVREANTRLNTLLELDMVMPPEGYFETRNFRKATEGLLDGLVDPLSAFPPGHPFRPFVLAPYLFATSCTVAPYSALQLIRSVHHLGRGLYRIEGGIDALKRIFLDKVKNNCGDYRDKSQVERFVMKRGKVKELVIRDRREVIGCDVVICNTDIKRFFNLIPEEAQKQRFHLKVLELQPTHWLYTVNFALRSEAIPTGMGEHAFVVGDPDGPMEGDNLLLCCVDPAGEQPEKGTTVLSVTARLPARTVRPTLENIDLHNQRIAHRLQTLFPFFNEHLLSAASAWVGTEKRGRNQFVDTTQFVPVYGQPLEDTFDLTAIASRTAYKNVLIAGDHLDSGLGFEGAFLGSLHATTL
ncbi:MAG: phytoene dehydrogenase-like protein, partial [Myxococcota bacterium]